MKLFKDNRLPDSSIMTYFPEQMKNSPTEEMPPIGVRTEQPLKVDPRLRIMKQANRRQQEAMQLEKRA